VGKTCKIQYKIANCTQNTHRHTLARTHTHTLLYFVAIFMSFFYRITNLAILDVLFFCYFPMFGDHSCCWIKLRCIGCGFWVENNRKRNEIGQVCWIEKRTDVRSSFPLFASAAFYSRFLFDCVGVRWCVQWMMAALRRCVHTVSRGGEAGIFCQIFCLKIFL